MFIYNYSGAEIDLAHIEYSPSTGPYSKEKEVFESIPDHTYRIYPANGFGPKHLECGFEIKFFKNNLKYEYLYDLYEPESNSCLRKLQKVTHSNGYYVVIAATGVFIKGTDGQWMPMIPQLERPAAANKPNALARTAYPANQ